MVEKNRKVAAALKENRRLLAASEIEIVESDAFPYIRNTRERFDLVLLDPPYDAELLPQLLPELLPLLTPRGVVYCEARKLPELSGWQVQREGKAGQVRHVLLARQEPAADPE
jgi:16S rRNA (guanine966-N2)-methyltransferase